MEFKNVLQGQYKTAWKQLLHENFPELDNLGMVPNKQDCRATELFIKKALHEEQPRDHQYIYMMPSSDCNVKKKIVTSPINHLH
jgi:hypothetical protein